MKKVIIILLLLIGITYTSCLTVNAQNTSFYEGEYIEGIWMNKYNPKNKTTYYQKARFFRQSGTNEIAYCIEPFSFFNENAIYEPTINPNNLTEFQKARISEIAHFGYLYKNHSDTKWYAITQFMIWQTADPTGDYYFTNSLNGTRINPYQNEINEINNLISQYYIRPSFENNTFYQVENTSLIIEDKNNVLDNYTYTDENITKSNNSLVSNYKKEGEYQVSLIRKDTYHNKPIIFFQSNQSQDLVETGDINDIVVNFKIIIQKTNLTLNKLDKDNKSTLPSGEAKLDGAKYNLYDSNNKLIQELIINNNQASIDNLIYGKYYLKEIEAGEGYKLDDTKYEFEITKDNPSITLELYNEVIKSNLIINKQFGEEDNLSNEENISFNIYDNNKKLINTITTDNSGNASIELPYGKYTLEQVNTKDGYKKNDNIDFIIDSDNDVKLYLKDLKIKVPNTHIDEPNIIKILLFILLLIV